MSDTDCLRRRSPQPATTDARTIGVRHRRSRHVPGSETRDLDRVCGDRCWVDGCPNEAFLQFAHRRAFRAGGANRAVNLLRLCRDHHATFDSGLWWPVRRRDGEVVLIDRRGVRVGRLRAPP